MSKLIKEKTPKRRLGVWEIVLLVLGSPIWISLLIAAFAVILSLYISLWAVIISFFAMARAGPICAGLSIFLFYGCKGAKNGTLLLTKKIFLGIKRSFLKKEEV